jgi:hypothetical protein
MNMIQKAGITKRELKKFTRELNLVEVTMANILENID